MGATYVDVTIRNPADRQLSWTGKFLVDTGAFDSLVPRVRLEEIGLEPRGSRDYVLANGNSVALDITIAEIEFEGEIVGGTIVYGEEGAEPLLGVTALESGGFEVDPRNEKLKRLPAVLLKAAQGFVHRSGRARGHRPYDDMSLMVLFAAIWKETDNMSDDKDGFVGGFIRGFCIVFFGGLIVLGIIIILLLAL